VFASRRLDDGAIPSENRGFDSIDADPPRLWFSVSEYFNRHPPARAMPH
jgi:hypothetical protein